MGWLRKLHIPSFTLHTSYSLLLLPLCLLAIKRSVPQTALETKALYPQQT